MSQFTNTEDIELSTSAEQTLVDCIDAFIKEPFAVENQLNELSLEAIEGLLEETKEHWEKFGSNELTLLTTPELEKSFQRCVQLFCSILLAAGNDYPADASFETLERLRDRKLTENTLGERLEDEPPVTVQPDVLADWHLNPLPNVENTEDKSDDNVSLLDQLAPVTKEIQEMELSLESSTAMEAPVEIEEEQSSLTFSQVTLAPMSAAPLISDAPPKDTQTNFELPSEFFSEAAPKTKEYQKLAEYLFSKRTDTDYTLEVSYLERFAAQALCYAVESEAHSRLQLGLAHFWPHREIAVTALLEQEGERFELHPRVMEYLAAMESQERSKLPDGKLTYGGLLGSLRYIVATKDLAKFRPTPLDLATLLLFFGQSVEPLPFENHLGIATPHQVALITGLLRLHKWRLKILGAPNPFDEEVYLTIRAETDALLAHLFTLHRVEPKNSKAA